MRIGGRFIAKYCVVAVALALILVPEWRGATNHAVLAVGALLALCWLLVIYVPSLPKLFRRTVSVILAIRGAFLIVLALWTVSVAVQFAERVSDRLAKAFPPRDQIIVLAVHKVTIATVAWLSSEALILAITLLMIGRFTMRTSEQSASLASTTDVATTPGAL